MNGKIARTLAGSLLILTSCRGLVIETALDPITMDHAFELGELPADPCPTVSRELMTERSERARIDIGQDAGTCRATLTVDDAELLGAEDARAIAASLQDVDVSAVVGIEAVVDSWSIEDSNGQPIDIASLTDAAVSLDGVVLFDVASLAEPEPPRVTMPESLRDAFVTGVENGQAVHASFELELTGTAPTAVLPPSLRVRATIRPVILVDVVDLVN